MRFPLLLAIGVLGCAGPGPKSEVIATAGSAGVGGAGGRDAPSRGEAGRAGSNRIGGTGGVESSGGNPIHPEIDAGPPPAYDADPPPQPDPAPALPECVCGWCGTLRHNDVPEDQWADRRDNVQLLWTEPDGSLVYSVQHDGLYRVACASGAQERLAAPADVLEHGIRWQTYWTDDEVRVLGGGSSGDFVRFRRDDYSLIAQVSLGDYVRGAFDADGSILAWIKGEERHDPACSQKRRGEVYRINGVGELVEVVTPTGKACYESAVIPLSDGFSVVPVQRSEQAYTQTTSQELEWYVPTADNGTLFDGFRSMDAAALPTLQGEWLLMWGVASEKAQVYLIDARDGRVRWRRDYVTSELPTLHQVQGRYAVFEVREPYNDSLPFDPLHPIFPFGLISAKVAALDLYTGHRKWTREHIIGDPWLQYMVQPCGEVYRVVEEKCSHRIEARTAELSPLLNPSCLQ